MKGKKLVTLAGGICIALVLMALPFMGACAKPAPTPEPIVLKLISFQATDKISVHHAGVYADMVTERAKGELIIDWIGGPEIVSMFDQPEAVRAGSIDMAAVPAPFYKGIVPEARAIHLSKLTGIEERESGFYELMNELHEKQNLYFLGRMTDGVLEDGGRFIITTGTLVETPEDLAGFKIRTAALYDDFLKALGCVPVTIKHAEVYTAMERGVIDGAAFPPADIEAYHLYEVVPYFIDHSFYRSPSVFIVNLDSWNRLPKHLQDLMVDAHKDMLPEMTAWHDGRVRESRQKMLDEGMEAIKFSPDVAKRYLDLAYDVSWDLLEEEIGPELTVKLRGLLTK